MVTTPALASLLFLPLASRDVQMPSLAVVYDTSSSLASCGCGRNGMAGFYGRHAAAVQDHVGQRLLLHLGKVTPYASHYPAVLELMRRLDYAALLPTETDLGLWSDPDTSPVPVVMPGRASSIGGVSVLLLREGAGPTLDPPSLVVVRGDEEAARTVARSIRPNVIIATGSIAWSGDVLWEGQTRIVVIKPGGDVITCLDSDALTVIPIPHHYRQDAGTVIAMRDYLALANSEGASSLPAAGPEESWGYAPARQCAECHRAQVEVWEKTAHAKAMRTLLLEGRFERECLLCHSEYYRRQHALQRTTELGDGVQCATCHGDCRAHVLNGGVRHVLVDTREAACRACHTPERSPRFDLDEYSRRISHSRP